MRIKITIYLSKCIVELTASSWERTCSVGVSVSHSVIIPPKDSWISPLTFPKSDILRNLYFGKWSISSLVAPSCSQYNMTRKLGTYYIKQHKSGRYKLTQVCWWNSPRTLTVGPYKSNWPIHRLFPDSPNLTNKNIVTINCKRWKSLLDNNILNCIPVLPMKWPFIQKANSTLTIFSI